MLGSFEIIFLGKCDVIKIFYYYTWLGKNYNSLGYNFHILNDICLYSCHIKLLKILFYRY